MVWWRLLLFVNPSDVNEYNQRHCTTWLTKDDSDKNRHKRVGGYKIYTPERK